MTRILISFILLTITACGQTAIKKESGNNNMQTKSDWKTVEQSNFSIKYPSTWELNESAQMGASFFLFSPLESDKDKFKENVNLVIQDLTGRNLDLNKYTEISEEQIKTMITKLTLLESKREKNDRGEYHKIIYSGEQGVFQLVFEQYYWVMNDKAFVLTFTSEKDKFEDYKEIAEKILNSFILKI